MSEEQKPIEGQEPDTFAPVSEEVKALAAAALAKLKDKPYSQRHPELGKMIKCQICQRRHRDHIKCEQKFTYIHTEQELDDDEHILKTTDIYRTAIRPDLGKPTAKQVVGSQYFKAKRKKAPLNSFRNQFIAEVRRLVGEADLNLEGEEDRKFLDDLRVIARRNLVKARRAKRKKKMRQQDVSRRINRGLLRPGFQA